MNHPSKNANNLHPTNTEHPLAEPSVSPAWAASSHAEPQAVSTAEPQWLVEERDACGVGFLAYPNGELHHDILDRALSALSCLEHRGGCGADSDSGDGAGITAAIPWKIIHQWLNEQGKTVANGHSIGVGMVFLPQDENKAARCREIVNAVIEKEDLQVLGWRQVPVNRDVVGPQASEVAPEIEQIVVASPQSGDDLERQLYLARRSIGKVLQRESDIVWQEELYFCSFSGRTIVYKAMVRSAVLGDFYLDLQNPDYQTSFAVYHRRFSTNTMPKWPLAQPMRLLGHNGEINTLLGNTNWMLARESDLHSPVWGDRIEDLKPTVNRENSDSATLDNVLELLVRSGRSPLEALTIMVPEAYQNQPELEEHHEVVDFYEYYNGLQEPWDGPALLVFTDGCYVGAALDRNGLRPARYALMEDGLVVVASEAGVIDLPASQVVEKGRLGPGQTIAVDLQKQQVLKNWDIKKQVAKAHPYGEWLQQYRLCVAQESFQDGDSTWIDKDQLPQQQMAFGYTSEDVEMIVEAMAKQGKEPTFCMGDDIPLAVLSDKPRLLYDYFKQRFAQVTNPAIDPLREGLVMSLEMLLGERGNLLDVKPEYAHLVKLQTPVLADEELQKIPEAGLPTETLSTLFEVASGGDGLRQAINQLCQRAAAAVQAGTKILILSDRFLSDKGNFVNLDDAHSYIPPLLAVGAVHHHLIRQGLRMKASIVVDTAQCWSTHHAACLIGYGASAVCPYMGWETVRHWWQDPKTQKMMERGKIEPLSLADALNNYRHAMEMGLMKILSKMGISLLSSYQGAQIFEAIGIGQELLDLAFVGTTSRIGGLNLEDLNREIQEFHGKAFPHLKKLENWGLIQYRGSGEYHINNPDMSKVLHKAVRQKNYDHYQVYKQQLENRPATALRDLLDFQSDRESISVDEVEPVEDIVKRFCTGGMSLGALSPEAHETLAIAMNRIGGKSNSGEGGEDPIRFKVFNDVDEEGHSQLRPHLKGLKNGDTSSSAIKQVASGRFGVTPEYLMNAKQIEIKIAQGAKPGEGGQLPGRKVSGYIAKLRRSKPGVTLISPPPHHDIYSIEDLAQLIFDLHQVNPHAGVSVKLVSSIGIGTIAAGVAKANADVIQISGHEGGTGASPLSSIKHAGSPWELGLTEVHRVLMENRLRDRSILRVDGGIRTGWDVLMAALMGAEEYGFGSISMIAEGCIMARICHTNNCPVGITTQQERLRQRFTGLPEHVVNFFYFVAEEVRSLLARLGYRRLDEVIGRSDLLTPRQGAKLTKVEALNLHCLTDLPQDETRAWTQHEPVHSNGPVLDDELLQDKDILAAIDNQSSVTKDIKILNTDRSVGGRLAGYIASKYGDTNFEGQIHLNFTGSAGQSFGAFTLPGMTLKLVGEANDYVGKGMHGGEICIVPPPNSTFDPAQNAIVGNTCLYGATGGLLFAKGIAGERFAVRNSFARAVVEGAGDHCCEYMTGGVVVALGKVGRNVGAGMTGGIGYFLDEDGTFEQRVNHEIVKVQRVRTAAGEKQLKDLIAAYAERTGSNKAKQILANWSEYLPKFAQVVPPSEENTPVANPEAQEEEKVAVASASLGARKA
ncbi:glutamate synthase large subunit [Geitlerinema sp. PCC 9228]|uniref:glutamate synthase large subunit n=1 Tax=Geitlerinema sp. PCC 9228 TaxID=111611 RepID=UPI000A043371|nr:glutamate synthase large subunit [Geitlerinema sp. PCC 9228]